MTIRIAVLGASGYTGSELVRLLVRHPSAELVALTADSKAGRPMAEVYPQFAHLRLPTLTRIEDLDPAAVDVVFCALPHATTQVVLKDLIGRRGDLKVVDLSADFRLADPEAYAKWYGHAHQALDLQGEAVYGLAEIHRDRIKNARLVANPGCYTTTSLLPTIPLLKAGAIDPDEIVVDAKTGMSGAGRAAKEGMLFSEVAEGMHAYGVANHRHTAELDQEMSLAAGRPVQPTFTPHLAPMIRGIYATIYVRGTGAAGGADLHRILSEAYAAEPFVTVLPLGQVPQSRHVKGSNNVQIGVVPDRVTGRAIVLSTLDNLVKGASGQAIQNMNLVCGLPETTGLEQVALFP
ncbi:N-acetyl-gamma-glutamyl-phosphate reductase [Pseudoxanthobacter sp. M-2]|uniref:N-acetyl-gamma-glutamyl-phosphate reductase n=1 Tax=Pseudoxanthobacter sp. M-2 TaxID=3078754 RepID=UPI0038FBE6EC